MAARISATGRLRVVVTIVRKIIVIVALLPVDGVSHCAVSSASSSTRGVGTVVLAPVVVVALLALALDPT